MPGAIKAHPELLFKAAEHAVGKPHRATDVDQGVAATVVYKSRVCLDAPYCPRTDQ